MTNGFILNLKAYTKHNAHTHTKVQAHKMWQHGYSQIEYVYWVIALWEIRILLLAEVQHKPVAICAYDWCFGDDGGGGDAAGGGFDN